MTLTKALGSFLRGPSTGMADLRFLFSANKEILLIEEDVDRAATILLRQADSFVSHLSDLVEIKLLNKQAAFEMATQGFQI